MIKMIEESMIDNIFIVYNIMVINLEDRMGNKTIKIK